MNKKYKLYLDEIVEGDEIFEDWDEDELKIIGGPKPKDCKVLIYDRNDLRYEDRRKPFNEIHIKDFIHLGREHIYHHDFYFFKDNDFQTRLLKSRWTDVGKIVNDYE